MIFLLFLVAAILLFGVCYLLLAKQAIFFSLIPENTKNQTFLSIYGYLHGILGILAVIVAFLDKKLIALFYLAILLIGSASFSLLFARKMKKTDN
ncbi:hypothetical protein [Enterococcus sp.]|jgi:hypothetical protein|uniref:hypothetical protein n=1 Tax=Enterococcus sp. TaxID=35783 RepID=UPI0025C59CA7|nr:hypothetical protein [Enterococcus sp.]